MKNIYLLTSVANLKEAIDVTDTTYDHVLQRLVAAATAECNQYCKRNLRGRTYGANGIAAEYHNGNGNARLYTDQYPIISVTSLYDDPDLDFGSDTLKTSSDYYIFSDQGIIQLNSDAVLGTIFQTGTANIKLIYTAGYDEFQIIENINDRIDFQESNGGTELAANLDSGVYTASSLATEIDTQLEAVGSDNYTVTYNYQTSKFTIASDGSYLKLLWSTGSNAYRTLANTIGFKSSDNEDSDGTVSISSDYSILGIPDDIEQACIEIANRMWQENRLGMGRFDKQSEQLSQGGTLKWESDPLPKHAKSILDRYKRSI